MLVTMFGGEDSTDAPGAHRVRRGAHHAYAGTRLLEGKRIVFATHDDWNLIRYRRDLMRSLVSAGAELIAMVPHGEFSDEWDRLGIRHESLDVDRSSLNPVVEAKLLQRMSRCIRQLQPDLLHTFTARPNIIGSIAGRWARVPRVVCSVTGRGSYFGDRPLPLKQRVASAAIRNAYRIAGRLADRFVFLNEDDRTLFTSAGIVPSERSVLIRSSGINVRVFSRAGIGSDEKTSLRRTLGIADNAPVILTVARLLVSKGIPEFVRAAAIVRRTRPDAVFLVVGAPDGGNFESLDEHAIRNLPGTNSVRWLGRRDDIRELLAITEIYVLAPTAPEGVPRSVLEAMSMELPIITSDVPGCRDTVVDGLNGFVVAPGDAESLARQIVRLLDTPDLRRNFGTAARTRAEEVFSVDRVVADHIAMYVELLSSTR